MTPEKEPTRECTNMCEGPCVMEGYWSFFVKDPQHKLIDVCYLGTNGCFICLCGKDQERERKRNKERERERGGVKIERRRHDMNVYGFSLYPKVSIIWSLKICNFFFKDFSLSLSLSHSLTHSLSPSFSLSLSPSISLSQFSSLLLPFSVTH
jgi:hypothetical protein